MSEEPENIQSEEPEIKAPEDTAGEPAAQSSDIPATEPAAQSSDIPADTPAAQSSDIPATEPVAQVSEIPASGTAQAADPAASRRHELIMWIVDILIAVVLAAAILHFISPTIVREHSMDDTLNNNDYLILLKVAYSGDKEPEYGDIVVFHSDLETDTGKEKLLIKRVIGKPGDTVAVADGYVYRNGEALEEPYTKDGVTNGYMEDTVVPDGCLFLLGDNRLVSVDSRDPSVGFVSEDAVIGKAVLRLFPFNKIGGLYSNYTGE